MRNFALACLVGIATAADIEQFRPTNWPSRNYAQVAHSHDHDHDDLEDDIDDAQADVLRLQTQLSDVEDKCDAQAVDIATLQGQVSTINGWVEPLSSQSIQNASDIAGLQASLPTLQTQVNDLENDLQAEKIKVAVLQSQIGTLTDLESRLTALENTVDTELTDLGNRLTTLEGQVTDLGNDISNNSSALGTLQNDVTNLQTQANDLQDAIDSFNDQKVLSDYFSVNDADIPIATVQAVPMPATDADYQALEFCVPVDQFVEIWAVANIPAASATTFVKAMELTQGGTVVASDSKSTDPLASNEDRSFVIFYKVLTTGAAENEFRLNFKYDTEGTTALNIPEKQLQVGYRTYASGYPTVGTAATCPP